MATPLGTNQVTSLSRRYIMPTIYDNLYHSILMFFRLNSMKKKKLQGGLHIEVPLLWANFAAGGPYQGFDLLDVSPSDTIKNAAFDWKQYYKPVSVDGLTLIRSDSPEAVVNFLSSYFEIAQMSMADDLGGGVWTDAVTNTKHIDGLKGAIDDGTVAATYGGLLRSTNTFWKSNIDSSTATLTLAAMQSMFGNCTDGGQHPTIIPTTQANYNRYWALSVSGQAFPVQPGGQDEVLAQNGFTNLLFNNVPLVVDSKVPANHIFFVNENYATLWVNTARDFAMEDFRKPVNQDAMTSLLLWAGNLTLGNCARQGKMTVVTA